jgi:hypothetical protein
MLPPPDTHDPAPEQSAEAAREAVVQADANRTWHGVQLKPWSEERQCLLDALCAADVPLPDVGTCNDVTFYHGMFPWAVKALYLAHHEPSDWERQRPRLLFIISQWGFAGYVPDWLSDEERRTYQPERANVPGETLEEKAAAVNFVWEMVNAHKKVMALRRVKRGLKPADSGNVPSP